MSAAECLAAAGLNWPVDRREVLVPSGRHLGETINATGSRALVRPDTEEIMSVVTNAYSVAENHWIADAMETLVNPLGTSPPMLAAVNFGRTNERSMFAARVRGDDNNALCLLAYNQHGGEGAVRFQLVEADRRTCAVYAPDSMHANWLISHTGNMKKALTSFARYSGKSMIDGYLAETQPIWTRLANTPWDPDATDALIKELWGSTPALTTTSPNGTERSNGEEVHRHPGHCPMLPDADDAANAYRWICEWLDNHSEACEPRDFTKSRDERLALGAGTKMKHKAWRWIVSNT